MTQQNSETRYFFIIQNGRFKGQHEVIPDVNKLDPEGLTGNHLEAGIKAVEKHLREKVGDVSELIITRDVVKDVVKRHNLDIYFHMCYSAREYLDGKGDQSDS